MTARLHEVALLPLAGFYDAAVSSYEAIDTTWFDDSLKSLYHESGRRLYNYLASAYGNYEPLRVQLDSLAIDHQRRLLDLLDHSSDEYLFNLGEYYFSTGDFGRATVLLNELIDRPTDHNLDARAYHHLSAIANHHGDAEAYRRNLALSAIADIESATLEVRSLQELGAAMYADGDIEHSYRYLTTALDNAVRCGATLRMIESSRALPMIGRAHTQQIAHWQRTNYIIISIMAVLLVALCISLWLRYRQMKRLDNARRHLRAANDSKDIYIGRFLQLCSIYMDKLDRFCKIVERKITAGKTDELLRMTRSGKFIEEQNEDFYKVFDDTFLHLYPDFVERVNELLQPDGQIVLADGERLNTDLRILAIKRMGVDDATTIARILNYSLNTIYAYRNRLKSKAIDRDSFEADIMKISPQAPD